MIKLYNRELADAQFRNVFLVQNRNLWSDCPYEFDLSRDLVLTFDFGLMHQVTAEGGHALYLDHLLDPDQMERYNEEIYRFFDLWYLDGDGRDLFSYRGIDFGNCLRLDFWNDVTYYVRVALNLMAVRGLSFERLLVGVEDGSVKSVLADLRMPYESWEGTGRWDAKEYYFPCFRWMRENIRPKRFRQRLGALLSRWIDCGIRIGELLRLFSPCPVDVFVDRYHPTEDVVEQLKADRRVNVVLGSYTRKSGMFAERRLPVGNPGHRHRKMALEALDRFGKAAKRKWEIEGLDIGEAVYRIIGAKIGDALPQCFSTIEAIDHFFAFRRLALFVVTANIGILNGVMLKYCAKNGVPVYFVINGLMLHKFSVEQIHEMTFINSYGESIKRHSFGDAENVVCKGDPRMDRYLKGGGRKEIDYREPTIVIGAGGFSNLDLNSYVAAEFDFMYDVMKALEILAAHGRKMKVVVKVRSNGYIGQYRDLFTEMFPRVQVEVQDVVPIGEVIRRADFYLSIYSGTLFEASLLGIPVLYYKKDTAKLHPPYDGTSELVIASSVDELVGKLELFYQKDPVYNRFMKREVLEKYIGPLDGGNVRRNVDFIYDIIGNGGNA